MRRTEYIGFRVEEPVRVALDAAARDAERKPTDLLYRLLRRHLKGEGYLEEDESGGLRSRPRQ